MAEQLLSHCLVCYEAGNQSAPQGAENRLDLGEPYGRADDQMPGRLVELDAGHPVVGQTLDDPPVETIGPADDLADGADAHESAHFLTGDETILQQRRVVAEIADAEEHHIGMAGEIDDIAGRA